MPRLEQANRSGGTASDAMHGRLPNSFPDYYR